MDTTEFFALHSGQVPLPDGRLVQSKVVDLGPLRVRSGKLAASDPFVNLEEPLVIPVRRGTHRAAATLVDVSDAQDWSHVREAYLSLVLSDAASVSVDGAPTVDGSPGDDAFYGVYVDAGTVSFTDAKAIRRGMPRDSADWYDSVFDTGEDDSWFSQMDADGPLPAGLANLVLPRARWGQNLVLCHSGWGDGFYPLLRSLDADGNPTGIHIDLLVAREENEDDEPEA